MSHYDVTLETKSSLQSAMAETLVRLQVTCKPLSHFLLDDIVEGGGYDSNNDDDDERGY